jgi:hypothetical protein
MAYDTLTACTCLDGCPACIQSSTCRLGNENMDKWAAIRLLREIRHRIGTSTGVQSHRQRYAADGSAYSELSLGRALEEIEQLTRRHSLESHMHKTSEPPASPSQPLPERAPQPRTPPRPARAMAPRSPSQCQFRENDPVQHGVYGRGIVLGSRIDGNVEQVTVRFSQRGGVVKTVPAAHGQLRKVSK